MQEESIAEAIRRQFPRRQEPSELREEILTGVLRALDLDRDWLEVTIDLDHIRIEQVGDAVDDLIGPMVNRPVIVHVMKDPQGRRLFRDIESAE